MLLAPRHFATFCIYFICLLTANAQIEADLQKGLTAFDEGRFEEAISSLEGVLNSGHFSDDLYYNLGNAYFQNKEPIKAILNYERALKINPRLEQAQFNLKIALEDINNELIEVPEFILLSAWRSIHTLLSSNSWSIIYLIFLWLAILALIYWLLGKDRAKKKKAFLGGIVCLALCIFTFFLSSSQYKWESGSKAAIVMEPLILRSAPEEENKSIMDLKGGTKLYFIDKIGEWNKIRLINGQVGWVKGENGLERI